MRTARHFTGFPVGVIRYNGKCTHELNKFTGEGKIVFDSPDHAAGWMQEQEHLHPQSFQPMNIYRCPYFTHYHLTSRPVRTVNGILVEDGNNAGEEAAAKTTALPVKPAAAPEAAAPKYKWRLDGSHLNKDAIAAAFKDGMSRQEIANKSGIAYGNICVTLRELGLGEAPRPRGPRSEKSSSIRKLATSLEELDAQQAALEAQMRKLAEDRQQIVEMNRVKVEWEVDSVSVRVGKHNESLVLTVTDWNTVVDGLKTLLA